MDKKSAMRTGVLIGCAIGGYVPLLWGSDFLSFASVICTAIGGIIGVYIGYKISQ